MEISYYINLFKKRLILIMMIIILGTATTVLATNVLFQKQYEAKITFWLTNFINDQGLLSARSIFTGPDLINDLKQMIISKEFIALWKADIVNKVPRIAQMDNDAIQEMIVFEVSGDTRVFFVGFRDSDPRTAVLISQTMSGWIQQEAMRIFQIKNLIVIDHPDAARRISPSLKKSIFYAAFLWTFIVIFMVLMIDISESRL